MHINFSLPFQITETRTYTEGLSYCCKCSFDTVQCCSSRLSMTKNSQCVKQAFQRLQRLHHNTAALLLSVRVGLLHISSENTPCGITPNLRDHIVHCFISVNIPRTRSRIPYTEPSEQMSVQCPVMQSPTSSDLISKLHEMSSTVLAFCTLRWQGNWILKLNRIFNILLQCIELFINVIKWDTKLQFFACVLNVKSILAKGFKKLTN